VKADATASEKLKKLRELGIPEEKVKLTTTTQTISKKFDDDNTA
jgi:hypothetical protein